MNINMNWLEKDLKKLENSLSDIDKDYRMSLTMNETVWAEYREILTRARLKIVNEIEIVKAKLSLLD